MQGRTVRVVADIVRLQETVHDAAFRNVQGKETILIEPLAVHKLIVFNGIAVDGMIFTERTLIHPAIWEDKFSATMPPHSKRSVASR